MKVAKCRVKKVLCDKLCDFKGLSWSLLRTYFPHFSKAPETKKCQVRFDKSIETWTILKPFAKSSHLDKNSRKKVREITQLTACPDVHKFSNVVQKPLKPCSSRHF